MAPADGAPDGSARLGAAIATAWRVDAGHCDLDRRPPPPRRHRLRALPQTITVDLLRSALVVVDMQNDFCHPQGWLASIGVDVTPARRPIPVLQQLVPWWRANAGPVVWLNWGVRPDRRNLSPALLHVYNPDGRSVGLGDVLPGAPVDGSRVLTEGHWGAALVDGLGTASGDIAIAKHRMSGFWDTPLDAVLREAGVSTLFFGGVNADQCVLATLMDAHFAGYDTVLVEDASATTSPGFCWDATLYNVRQCFGFTTRVDHLLAGGPS
jgi:ureidoacrylate peracid hydrolase